MGIQVPPDSTGSIVETITLTDHRQVFILGGDNAIAERASVKNIVPAATDYGLTARAIQRREGSTLSTANLGVAGVFSQGGQDGNEDGTVFVAALAESDQNSAAQGFTIEEYDGDDDDFTDASLIRTVAAATYTASSAQYIYARIRGRKWRVKYTNGGTGQGSFKLTVAASSVVQDHHLDYDSGAGTVELPAVGIALPGAGGPVAGGTAANPLNVASASLPLPAGAATAALQLADGHNVTVDNASIVVTNTVLSVVGGGTEAAAQRVTLANDSTGLLPVSAASLPLPAGAATSAGQLADGHNVAITGAVTVTHPAIGGGVEAAAQRVTIASDSTGLLPISAASLPLPTGAATSALQLASGHNVTADAGTGDFLTVIGHTRNEAFKESGAVGGELDDTTTVVATEGNVSPVRITAQRAFHSNLRSVDGTELGTTGNPVIITDDGSAILVDGSGVTQPVSGTITVTHPAIGGGVEAGAQRVTLASDSTGVITVDAANDSSLVVRLGDGTDLALISAAGALFVDASATTQPISGTVTANAGTGDFLSIVGHTINESFKEAAAIGGQLDDAATTAATEDNIAPVRITAQRGLHINLRNNAGTEIGTTTTELETNVNIGGTAASGNDGTADAGTLRVTLASDGTGKVEVVGDVAEDAPAAGNPVLIGLRASETEGTRVADDDAIYGWGDLEGRFVTVKNHPALVAADSTHGPKQVSKSTTAIQDVIAAPGASLSIYLTSIFCSNTASTTNRIDLSDGATVRDGGLLAGDGGGFVRNYDPPWKMTANTAFRAALSAATNVRINVHYYVAP